MWSGPCTYWARTCWPRQPGLMMTSPQVGRPQLRCCLSWRRLLLLRVLHGPGRTAGSHGRTAASTWLSVSQLFGCRGTAAAHVAPSASPAKCVTSPTCVACATCVTSATCVASAPCATSATRTVYAGGLFGLDLKARQAHQGRKGPSPVVPRTFDTSAGRISTSGDASVGGWSWSSSRQRRSGWRWRKKSQSLRQRVTLVDA